MSRSMAAPDAYRAIAAGDRRALARALSRAESTLAADRGWLDELWAQRAAGEDAQHSTLRLGITGPPGVGKSTLIESLGSRWLDAGKTLAVLPIDPSSPASGGSLLADKTRMTRLASAPGAFVRPSAACGMLGGLSSHVLESIELCELAGFDLVVVETVGVGQSELDAGLICDRMLLLLTASSGDDLSMLKRGITEVCDVVIINKQDNTEPAAVDRMLHDVRSAMHLLGKANTLVLALSALKQHGLPELLDWVCEQQRGLGADPTRVALRRAGQREAYFERVLQAALLAELRAHPKLQGHRARLVARVRAGSMRAQSAATELLRLAFGDDPTVLP